MARVLLLVEDAALTALLERAGHEIVRSREQPHDLIVSAVAMPSSARPVIVYTQPGDVEARIKALDLGAADAFDAGFPPTQMVARVGAVARRAAPERVEADGCVLDLAGHAAVREGQSTPLTSREVDIVRWLHQHRNRIVSREELLEHVWGVSPDNATRAVDVAISALRSKVERDPRAPVIIVSKKGAGYRWVG